MNQSGYSFAIPKTIFSILICSVKPYHTTKVFSLTKFPRLEGKHDVVFSSHQAMSVTYEIIYINFLLNLRVTNLKKLLPVRCLMTMKFAISAAPWRGKLHS